MKKHVTDAENDLRSTAEAFIRKEDTYNSEELEKLSLREINSIVHELKVYQIELEMQNDELRRTQSDLETMKARYFDIYDLAPVGYLIISEKGIIVESNLTAAIMLGESRDILAKKRITGYIFKEDQDLYYRYRKELFETMLPHECELRLLKRDHSIFWGHMKSSVVIEDGLLNCRMVLSDISCRKAAEKNLIDSEKNHRQLITQMTQGLVVLEALQDNMSNVHDYYFIDSNEAFEKMTGLKREAIIGKQLLSIMPDIEHSWLKNYEYVAMTGEPLSFEHYSTELGKYFEITAYSPNLKQVAAIFNDITERKSSEDKLLYLSTHDHLTGLYNRRYYEQKLKALDTKENLPLSVIMFDVNGLKMVNDSFGHDFGDVLLNKAAETIKKACREEDFVARIGGDEFVLVLPKTSADNTEKIVNHINALTSKEIISNIELSISHGYDTKETENQSISQIVVNAENRMYKNKLFERTSIKSKTIELIMNTIFEKSILEAQHSRRVSRICQAIAAKMDLGKHEINQMKVAGLLHDIGKIGVDEKILNKTASLTTIERVDIERHPEIGWRLLSSTNEFSDLALSVIQHHEKWDGSGYPNGLNGEAIQLEARIIAVAEAYDAMTNKSSDKKLAINEAAKELTRCSGTQFDPKIVEVLIELISSEHEDF